MSAGLGKTGIAEIGLGIERPSPGLAPVGHAIAGDRMSRGAQERLILPPRDLVATDGERLGDANFPLGPFVAASASLARRRPDRKRADGSYDHFRATGTIAKSCASSPG
jgi:hypothetical protein